MSERPVTGLGFVIMLDSFYWSAAPVKGSYLAPGFIHVTLFTNFTMMPKTKGNYRKRVN
ncbi:hypothetical protein [Dulcicalothrix desertica]|uniref:hypothetical protein n=1 Tax=Dulcicalothrix desertica TaxID=32056 RepID=UPI0016451D66|nr:hypothetical protein [Dulcicalothrix desertica]